jgi:AAHS family 4-hydroxybenzoate transporter-like MFS transporter
MTARPLDVGRTLDEGKWGGYQKFVVFLSALAIIFDGIDNQLLGIAIPSIMREWSVSRQAFANVGALGFAGMLVGGSLAGLAGDRVGRRFALIASMLIFGAMTLAASQVNSVTALGLVRMLVGVGLGGAIPTAATLSSEFVPRRHRPFAVTLTIVCVPLGGMLAGLVAQPLLPAFGWRGLFMIGGSIPFIAAFLFIWLLPESPRFLARRRHRWPELFRVLHRAGHAVDLTAPVVDSTEQDIARASFSSVLMPSFARDTLGLWGAFFRACWPCTWGLHGCRRC